MTLLAAVSAIAVAVIALAVVGRRHPEAPAGPTTTKPAASTNEHAAAVTAALLLGKLVLPAGAIESGSDPSSSSQLAMPGDRLGTPDLIDIHRFWRLPGDPHAVIRWIEVHPPAGSQLTVTGRGAHYSVTVMWSAAFSFPAIRPAVIWRELSVETAAAQGGGTALRADGEAVWAIPRSAAERIPDGTDRLQVATGHLLGGDKPTRALTLTSPARIHSVVGLLNALPAAQPGIGGCTLDTGFRVRLTFESRGRVAPTAVALVDPACGTIQLTISGRPQPTLAVGLIGWNNSRYRPLIKDLESGSL